MEVNEAVSNVVINWDALSAIGTCIGAIITAVLTYIIIHQTGRLNKEQAILEERMNEQQMALQKRQIKVDIFPYKRELFLNLFRVTDFTNFLTNSFNTLNLSEKTCEQLHKLYEMSMEQYLGDQQKIFHSLREAEYILPKNVTPTVTKILVSFDDICSRFIAFKTFAAILTKDEIEKIKIQNLLEIKKLCEEINSKVGYIQSIMPHELYISDLDR